MHRDLHPEASNAHGKGRWPRRIAFLVAVLLAFAIPVHAQQRKPVMENVFYNVVWGSATGALIGAALAVMGASDKTNPGDLRIAAFQGATAGGLIGYGVGVWLVFSGITFDPQGSTLTGTPDDASYVAQASPGHEAIAAEFTMPPTPLFTLETSATIPHKITGFKALVVDLRF